MKLESFSFRYIIWSGIVSRSVDKAAVLMRELIRGHAFEAANKRVGIMAALTFLDENGYTFHCSVNDAKTMTTRIAMDQADVGTVSTWLRKHSK